MKKTFISMPGIVKGWDLGTVVEDSLEVVSRQEGVTHEEGFSTRRYLKSKQFLNRANNISRFLVGPFRRLYWDVTMHMCVKQLRKHDAVLGILPEPVKVDRTSLSLGVVNEFAEAFSSGIPLYITTFNPSAKEITGFYRPEEMMDVLLSFKDFGTTGNLFDYLIDSPQFSEQLGRRGEKTKPDILDMIGNYFFRNMYGIVSKEKCTSR